MPTCDCPIWEALHLHSVAFVCQAHCVHSGGVLAEVRRINPGHAITAQALSVSHQAGIQQMVLVSYQVVEVTIDACKEQSIK